MRHNFKIGLISLCSCIIVGLAVVCSYIKIDAATLSMPNNVFIEKDDLIELCKNTNEGKGMLATGTDSDVELKINYGHRPNDANYYISWDGEKKVGQKATVVAGEITWLVAGHEKNDRIVLYAQSPLTTIMHIDGNIDSQFLQPKGKENGMYVFNYDSSSECMYEDGQNPEKVYSNHWGICKIRKRLKNHLDNFSAYEKKYMLESTISTYDERNKKNYKTNDTLYVPAYNVNVGECTLLAGENDNLLIDKKYWNALFWLRTPAEDTSNGTHVYIAMPQEQTWKYGSESTRVADNPVFALDIKDVNFVTVAKYIANTEGFVEVDTNDSMRIRLGKNAENYMFDSKHKVICSSKDIKYNAPQNSRLMVLVSDKDGKVYQYSKTINSNEENGVLKLKDISGLDKNKDYSLKAWLEMDVENEESTLTYATNADSINIITTWGDEVKDREDGIVQYVDVEGKTSLEVKVQNAEEISIDDGNGVLISNILWLKENNSKDSKWFGLEIPKDALELDKGYRFYVQLLDVDSNKYNQLYSQIDENVKAIIDEIGMIILVGIEDADGNKVKFTEQLKLYVEIPNEWNVNDLKSYYVQDGQDEEVKITYNSDIELDKGNKRFGVITIEHFSPYVIFNKISKVDETVTTNKPTTFPTQIPTVKPSKRPTGNDTKDVNVIDKTPDTRDAELLSKWIILSILSLVAFGIMRFNRVR